LHIIFSRKGFDSSFGGCPSPILEGRPLSLPIPTRQPTLTCFGDLRDPIPKLVEDLTCGKIRPERRCHLDPDLDEPSLPERPTGWRGALGQVAAARAHLRNQRVGPGDLFLFWGLFRPVEQHEGRWRYVSLPIHAIFGWLQVAEVHENPGGGQLQACPWLERHPHVQHGWGDGNAIFVGRESLSFSSMPLPGFGVFRRPFQLTAVDRPYPSLWQVPDWLHASRGGVGMTYHPASRWLEGGQLRCAARGQEFVACVSSQPDAFKWAGHVIEAHR
jgi:Nucleotide modification associated domain 3